MNRKQFTAGAFAALGIAGVEEASARGRCNRDRGYSRADIRRALERKLDNTGIVLEFRAGGEISLQEVEDTCNPLTIEREECQSTVTWSPDGFIDAVMRRLDG